MPNPESDLRADMEKALEAMGVGTDDDDFLLNDDDLPPPVEEAGAGDEEENANPSDSPAAEEGGDDAEAEAGADEDDIEPPQQWTQAEKDRFRAIKDPEAKRIIIDRDKHQQRAWQARATETNQDVQLAGAVRDAFRPYAEDLRKENMTEAQAVSNLMLNLKRMNDDPASYIRWVASQKKLDLADIASGGPGSSADEDDFTDPGVRALREEMRAMRQEIGQVTQRDRSQTEQQAADAWMRTFNEMAEEKTSAGVERYPYFLDVIGEMSEELANAASQKGGPLTREDLANLYESKRWTIPVVRDALIQRQAQSRQQSPGGQKQTRARAARTTVPSQNAAAPAPKEEAPLNERDVLRAQLEQNWDKFSQSA